MTSWLMLSPGYSYPEPSNYLEAIKGAIRFSLCNVTKLSCGFMFGTLMWWALVEPYGYYFNFERDSYRPEFLFCMIVSLVFMLFTKARAIMVLFLPAMIGSATQNYIIVLVVLCLFRGPATNIGLNAVECVRVIGCSLTMVFEQLKARAKLIANPIVDAINGIERTDIDSIHENLVDIKQVVLDMRKDADFSSQELDALDREKAEAMASKPVTQTPSNDRAARELQEKLNIDAKTSKRVVDKVKEVIGKSSVTVDDDMFGLKVKLDLESMKRLRTDGKFGDEKDFDLIKLMHENCLTIFRRAKHLCEDTVDEMHSNCQKTIGSFLATVFCKPVTFSISSACPWIMNQIIDENNLCNQMLNSTTNLRIQPLNVTSNDINKVYQNLTQLISSLREDRNSTDPRLSEHLPQRLELNISFNKQTKSLFLRTKHLLEYIRDKFRLRHAIYLLIRFAYDIYTSITFCNILLSAIRYHSEYLRSIRFDNKYITGLFVRMDTNRRKLAKTAVLPLTKEESEMYITAFTCKRRTSEEKHAQQASCWSILLFFIFSVSLIYMDKIFYDILNSVHQHGRVSYKQVGVHELDVRVKGEGPVAQLVRKLTSRLTSLYKLDKMTTTGPCLPLAMKTDFQTYLLFILYSVSYVTIEQGSIYAMRLRRPTMAFFYPDKEVKRTVYLYNHILVQRKALADLGLASYAVDEKFSSKQSITDYYEPMFTVRDSFAYIRGCVSASLSCCCSKSSRHSSSGPNDTFLTYQKRRQVRPHQS